MKKSVLLLAIAGAMVVGTTSCKKEEMPKAAITQTIDQNLRVGETYTFTLPKNLRDDEYLITTQALHASISEVGRNSAGEQVYTYTPEAGYSGSDMVIVSNDQERTQQCVHPQGPPPPDAPKRGKCNGEDEDHYIITMNFVMKGSESVPAAN